MNGDAIETDPAAANKLLAKVMLALFVLVAVGTVLGVSAGKSILTPSGLAKCEDAIREGLKAPSTYKRIKATGDATPNGYYMIDYDASNSYGVAIRGSGMCFLEGGSARWAEIPQP